MRYALIVILLLPAVLAKSQQDSIALSDEYYRMGMEIFDYEHRKQASELFILSSKINPNNAKAFFMAGQSIMLSLKKGNALPYYKAAYALDKRIDSDILFYIGKAHHYSENFDSALIYYNQYYMQLLQSNVNSKSKKKEDLIHKMEECYYAKLMTSYPVNVSISNLGENVNSEYPDYAPAVDKNDQFMIFTTRRPEQNKNMRVAKDHEYYEDIFFSVKNGPDWNKSSAMHDPLNTNFHNASIAISPDGSEILLYNDANGGDIYITYKQADGSWSVPVALEGVNTSSIENSASITQDNKTLYFTSNRPGGFGGTDIYVCVRDSRGRWGKPQNLGSIINTERDEEGVYISANGKHLYFSSNGHLGMGDLDIFRSSFNEQTQLWERPINMGYPLNSVENDIYFVMSGTENIAYFASVREPSFGEEDIYRLDLNNWSPAPYTRDDFVENPQKINTTAISSTTRLQPTLTLAPREEENNKASSLLFQIYVADGSTFKPIPAQVTLSKTSQEIVTLTKTENGNYECELKIKSNEGAHYKLHVSSNDYIPFTSNYYFVGSIIEQPVIVDTVFLDKISVNYNRILNVYFDINSDVPKSLDDVRYLEQLMKSSPSIKVEISGHTDNTGEPEYNITLSKRRSDAIKKYLVSSGIDPGRITTQGYGATKPLADNANRPGRALNRRTEFTIIAN